VNRRYDSFLVRCWALDTAEPRIEVEHIQSGRRVHMASLDLAVAWMDSSAAGDRLGPSGSGSGEDHIGGKGNG
jgi:hypothetical protein